MLYNVSFSNIVFTLIFGRIGRSFERKKIIEIYSYRPHTQKNYNIQKITNYKITKYSKKKIIIRTKIITFMNCYLCIKNNLCYQMTWKITIITLYNIYLIFCYVSHEDLIRRGVRYTSIIPKNRKMMFESLNKRYTS